MKYNKNVFISLSNDELLETEGGGPIREVYDDVVYVLNHVGDFFKGLFGK